MASEDLTAWAGRILENLQSGTSTTGQIVSWLQYNPYRLNAAFGTNYALSGSGITPTITRDHSGIYEGIFTCYYLNKRAMDTLGVAEFDLVESEMNQQGRMRFVSKNEKAKTFRSLARDCDIRLADLIKKIDDDQGGFPLSAQIIFGDRQNMIYGTNPCDPMTSSTVFSQFYRYDV
jgi:hypothetical protein